MPKYALLMYNPTDQGPAANGWSGSASKEEMAAEHQKWQAFYQELSQAGALVFNQGLQGPDVATTVRVREGETQITDGPFAETKELLGGIFLIEAEDLDAAIKWAEKVPNATYGSVEVRPAWG